MAAGEIPEEPEQEESPIVTPELRPTAPPFEFDAPEWRLDDDEEEREEEFPSTPESLELEEIHAEEENREREFFDPTLMGAWAVADDEEEMEEIRFAEDVEEEEKEGEGEAWEAKSLLELYLY